MTRLEQPVERVWKNFYRMVSFLLVRSLIGELSPLFLTSNFGRRLHYVKADEVAQSGHAERISARVLIVWPGFFGFKMAVGQECRAGNHKSGFQGSGGTSELGFPCAPAEISSLATGC